MKRYFALMLLVVALPVFGEDLPDAPRPAYIPYIAESSSNFVNPNRSVSQASTHKFLDRGNYIRMGILAGLVAADGISTQEILNNGGHWREMDPASSSLCQ